MLRDLGEIGALGLYVDEAYGGQGLSQTGYARVFETVGQIDATLAIVLGVHQSIGFKGISLFGTDEQKERFLPDLATGKKLAAFALTEPEAGSDAYNLQSRAVRQSDGSWVLNGEKRYIGNGSRADVITTFARAEIDGEESHIALLLEKGMEGLEVGERFDTMGLRANDLRRLYFKDVRVPPENVLGEPGQGFRVAMQVLNNGRIGLGTGAVGGAKKLLDLAIDHVKERRQFGRPLADFELVQDKIGWMVTYLFGLESMCYLTCGLVDAERPRLLAGVGDLQGLRDGVPLVRGQPRPAARRRRGLHARPALREGAPRHPHLSDLRGGQRRDARLHRTRRLQAGRREARGPLRDRAERPDRLDRGADRLRRATGSSARSARTGSRMAHEDLSDHADAVSDQVKRLAGITEKLLREHRKDIVERQFQQKRLADNIADIYAQIAVLSRVSQIFEDQGVEPSGTGALHRRHLLQPSGARASTAGSTRSSRTTTSG